MLLLLVSLLTISRGFFKGKIKEEKD